MTFVAPAVGAGEKRSRLTARCRSSSGCGRDLRHSAGLTLRLGTPEVDPRAATRGLLHPRAAQAGARRSHLAQPTALGPGSVSNVASDRPTRRASATPRRLKQRRRCRVCFRGATALHRPRPWAAPAGLRSLAPSVALMKRRRWSAACSAGHRGADAHRAHRRPLGAAESRCREPEMRRRAQARPVDAPPSRPRLLLLPLPLVSAIRPGSFSRNYQGW